MSNKANYSTSEITDKNLNFKLKNQKYNVNECFNFLNLFKKDNEKNNLKMLYKDSMEFDKIIIYYKH